MIKAVIGVILSIIAIPIIALFLLFDYTPNIPVEDYVYESLDVQFANQIEASVERLSEGELSIQLDQPTLNKMLYAVIVDELNADYDPASECENDECRYVLVEEIDESQSLAVTGMWVRLRDDVISFNVGLRLMGTVPFQTRVRFDFQVIDTAETLEISYERLQVGNIPLPAFIVRPIVNAALADGTQTIFSNEFFEANIEDLTIDIDKTKFVESQIEDPQLALFADIIIEEQLIRFEVSGEQESLSLFIDVDKLTTQKPVETYTANREGLMFDLLLQLFLNQGTDQSTLFITDESLNELLAESFADLDVASLIDQPELQRLISIQTPWIDLVENDMVINIPLTFAEKMIRMEITFAQVTGISGLEFELSQITIGYDADESTSDYVMIDQAQAQELLRDFEFSNDFIQYNQVRQTLVISTSYLNEQLSTGIVPIVVEGVRLRSGQIEIDVALGF